MLDVVLPRIHMKNPIMLASGICDLTRETMERCHAAGAIVTKSIGLTERKGYQNPVFTDLEFGILNAIGLANPGIDEMIKELVDISIDNVVGSIFGADAESYNTLANAIAPHVAAIEMNMSCPHAKMMGADYLKDEIPLAVKAAKSAKKPVFVKLGMDDVIQRAQAAIDGGADGIVAINSIKAMAINIDVGMPVLSNRIGGYSGAAIKPIGVRCVYELAEMFDSPVIGVGGIMKAEDVIEYMMAGASAVQVGTALYYRGNNIFSELCFDLKQWLEHHGYNHINDIKGIALRK